MPNEQIDCFALDQYNRCVAIENHRCPAMNGMECKFRKTREQHASDMREWARLFMAIPEPKKTRLMKKYGIKEEDITRHIEGIGEQK